MGDDEGDICLLFTQIKKKILQEWCVTHLLHLFLTTLGGSGCSKMDSWDSSLPEMNDIYLQANPSIDMKPFPTPQAKITSPNGQYDI